MTNGDSFLRPLTVATKDCLQVMQVDRDTDRLRPALVRPDRSRSFGREGQSRTPCSRRQTAWKLTSVPSPSSALGSHCVYVQCEREHATNNEATYALTALTCARARGSVTVPLCVQHRHARASGRASGRADAPSRSQTRTRFCVCHALTLAALRHAVRNQRTLATHTRADQCATVATEACDTEQISPHLASGSTAPTPVHRQSLWQIILLSLLVLNIAMVPWSPSSSVTTTQSRRLDVIASPSLPAVLDDRRCPSEHLLDPDDEGRTLFENGSVPPTRPSDAVSPKR